MGMNNPQQGGKVPQAFKDKNLNTVPNGNLGMLVFSALT